MMCPDGARPEPVEGARLPSRVAVLALLVLAAALPSACGPSSADQETSPPEPNDLVVFVYDRSASIPDYKLELARDLTDQRLRLLRHGDRVAALEMLQLSLSEPPRRWSQRSPEREFANRDIRRDSVALARFVRDAQDYLIRFTSTEEREHIGGTDILSTLHDVASEVNAYPDHRPVLYIFSDMLQSNRVMDFERGNPVSRLGWVREADREGRLPGLNGVCVVVVGARTDTDHGQAVQQFWTEYFERTGATLLRSNYVLRPVRLDRHPCGGSASASRSGA